MEEKDNKHWRLLMTKPFKEGYAEEQLSNQGYEAYYPLTKRLRKRKNKMQQCVEPLFPKYIFIKLNTTSDDWSPIRSTRGVSHFIRFGEEPAKVSDIIIETLKTEEKKFSDKVFDLDHYHSGQPVMINNGAFQNIEGVFKCYDGEERAMVLIKILQTTSTLTVRPTEITGA